MASRHSPVMSVKSQELALIIITSLGSGGFGRFWPAADISTFIFIWRETQNKDKEQTLDSGFRMEETAKL